MHRLASLLFVVAMVSWLAFVPAGAATQSQVTLTVSVVDQGDDPVGNANVTASWDGGERTRTTASNGRVFVDVPEGANVSLTVDHPEFVRNSPVVVNDASEQEVTIQVSRKGESTVTALDAEGEPLANATVEFHRNGSRVVAGKTGSDGTFSTGVVEQGEYFVSVVKPGYFRNTSNVQVSAETSHTFRLERGTVRLNVNVYDDHFENRRKLEGATVLVVDDDGVVANVRASGGSVSVSVGVNTKYTIVVSLQGYLEEEREIFVREADRLVDVSTQRVPTLVLDPQNDRVVVGETTQITVLNAYNETVAGATVLQNGESVGETDANGELTVTIDSAGTHEFRATKGSVESQKVTIQGFDPDATDEPTATPSPTSGIGAGFGVAVAIVSLAVISLLRRRR